MVTKTENNESNKLANNQINNKLGAEFLNCLEDIIAVTIKRRTQKKSLNVDKTNQILI